MTTEARYIETTELVPSGDFYDGIGYIIPYKSNPTSIRLTTNYQNSVFSVYVNEIYKFKVTTDVNGNAVFNVQLPLGDIILELKLDGANAKIVSYLTTRNYSVWHAAHAEAIETIDNYIDSTLKAFRLAEAESTDIDLAHGVRLLTPNEFGAGLEAYREILQNIHQAFRNYGGRLSGKRAIISAITQVNPLIYLRSVDGQRWILGYNKLPNGDFSEAARAVYAPTIGVNINSNGDFVTNIKVDPYVNTGLGPFSYQYGQLTYNRSLQRFKWVPPLYSFTDFFDSLAQPRYYESPIITQNGNYEIPSGRYVAFLASKRITGSFVPSINDRLYLNVDDRGDFAVTIPASISTSIFDDLINISARESGHYFDYRLVDTQPAGVLDGKVEIIKVSDRTNLGFADTVLAFAYLTVLSVSGVVRLSYKAPTDGSYGPYVYVNPGDVVRLYSANGTEYIEVLVGKYITSSAVGVSFKIKNKYYSLASYVPFTSQINVISQNNFVSDGDSSIKILDGPFSAHREVFGLETRMGLLQQSVVAGDDEIVVPAGTMESLNNVNGTVNLPFDVIIGRGVGPQVDLIPDTFDITPVPGNETLAVIDNFSTLQLKRGYTHIKFANGNPTDIDSTQWGIHQIVSIDELANSAIIKFGGVGINAEPWETAPPTTFPHITIIAADPSMKDVIAYGVDQARISWDSVSKFLKFKPPYGTVYGNNLITTTGNYYKRIYSNSTDGYKWIDVWVNPSISGAATVNDLRLHIIKNFVPLVGVGNTQFWSTGEKAIVTEVIPSGLNEIWKLSAPLTGNYDITLGSYEVLPRDRVTPYRTYGKDTFGNVNFDIDTSHAPLAGFGTVGTTQLEIDNPRLPSGWIDKSLVPINYYIVPDSRYYKGAIFIDNETDEVVFERNIPYKENQLGYTFTFKVWARNISRVAPPQSIEIKLAFDFGTSVFESPGTILTDNNETIQYPKMIEFSQILPVDATQFKVRIIRTTGGDGPNDFLVDRAVVLQELFDSLYLGDGTIPRSGSRSKFGSLFYIWSSDELSSSEKSILGVAAPSTSGLIREVHNSHEQIDAFDVTDVVGGNVVNVRGTITEADWVSANKTNLEVISRTPTRFSNVVPINITKVNLEEVQFSQVPSYIATLAFECDENQDESILYENGIPLPNNQWQFNSSTEVEITLGFVPGATYTIDYNRLTRIETTPIDLVVPPNNGNEVWFADYVVWNRQLSTVTQIRETSSIFFDAAFEATLPRRSDKSKINSILTEDTGVNKRIVPANAWSYKDSLTIKINSNEYNPEAIYNIEYNQQLTDPIRAISVLSEIRSANSVFSLMSEPYYEFNINDIIDSSKRYHQIRLTFFNITDIRDLKVFSAVVKGLNMSGAGSPPPGF